MRMSDWSADVCSSDLNDAKRHGKTCPELDGQKDFPIDARLGRAIAQGEGGGDVEDGKTGDHGEGPGQRRTHMMAEKTGEGHPRWRSLCHGLRSEEHTSELQSLMRISYAVFCLKKNNTALVIHLYTY